MFVSFALPKYQQTAHRKSTVVSPMLHQCPETQPRATINIQNLPRKKVYYSLPIIPSSVQAVCFGPFPRTGIADIGPVLQNSARHIILLSFYVNHLLHE